MPNPALNRRDPLQGKKGFSTHKGFTVIELMIALAVLAIITSLALPSYRMIIEKRQVTSGAEQFKAFMSSAQLESVRRNQFVAVNYEWNGGDWCLGMRAGDDNTVSCDCTDTTSVSAGDACAVDGAFRVLSHSDVNYPQALASTHVCRIPPRRAIRNPDAFTFLPRAIVIPAARPRGLNSCRGALKWLRPQVDEAHARAL